MKILAVTTYNNKLYKEYAHRFEKTYNWDFPYTVYNEDDGMLEAIPECKKFVQQSGKCYWSKIPLDEKYNYITKHPLAISVDRLDNTIGYCFDNVALTLRVFNLGKGSYKGDFPEVIEHLKEQWL